MTNLSSLFGSSDAWAQYRAKAQQGTQGIGNIPFVFSNYAGIPSDPAAAMAMFYQRAKPAAQVQQAPAQNPILSDWVTRQNPNHRYGKPGDPSIIDQILGRKTSAR